MGGKSKLADGDWEAIARRLRDGAAPRDLGREFGVSEAMIRWRFPAKKMGVDAAAGDGLAVQGVLHALLHSPEAAPVQPALLTSSPMCGQSSRQASPPFCTQVPLPSQARVTSRQLAAMLADVTEHLSDAALTGAEMARRLADMASAQVAQLEVMAHGAHDGAHYGAVVPDALGVPGMQASQAQRALPEKMIDAIKRVQLLTAASNNAAELGMNLLKANKELTHAEGEPTPVTIAFTVKDARVDADDNIFAEPAAGQVPAAAA